MKIKLLDINCIPTKTLLSDVGMDLKSRIDISLHPGETAKIPLGVCIEIPHGRTGDIRPRSGLTSKGLIVHYGTVDPGYTGEVAAIVTNLSSKIFMIEKHDRIAQLVVIKVENDYGFDIVSELGNTERGGNGFGSTGK